MTSRNNDETITVDQPRATPAPRVLLLHRHGLLSRVLEAGRELRIGRAAPAELCVDDPSLSRLHATLCWRDGVLSIVDAGSKNGLLVNGLALQRATLDSGDEVRLGEVTLHVVVGAVSHGELCDHERFLVALERGLARARFAHRPATLLLLEGGGAELPWLSSLAAAPGVSAVASYAPGRAEVLLAEADAATAEAFIAAHASAGRGAYALFPEHGDSAEALLEAAASSLGLGTRDETPGGAGEELVVVDEAMVALYETARRAAASPLSVLLRGETGVGKELLARAIHEASPRREGPFVALNCGALPPSLLESELFGHERGAFTGAEARREGAFARAHGGTLFLDEVGELGGEAQVALLRALAEGEILPLGAEACRSVDVRVVAATHADLEAGIAGGDFRQDLYYRLAVIALEVPPLRERHAEIVPLAERFLRGAKERHGSAARGFSAACLERLRAHLWPGNVRELKNTVERAAVLARGEVLEVEDLPASLRDSGGRGAGSDDDLDSFRHRLQRYEAELIAEALRAAGYNQSEAARRLHMPLRTMVRKIKSYGLGR